MKPSRRRPKSRLIGALLRNRVAKNVSANMIGGAWNGLLIVLATPWYVSLLGLEGYGILGFWLLMQVILSLFDLGLGATLVREFADSRAYEDRNRARRTLLRTLEWVYWPIAAGLTTAVFLLATPIATRWLELRSLPVQEAASAIRWMAVTLGLQYPGALYSSGLAGLQSQGRMNLLQMLGNTLRYGGGVAVLLWKPDLVLFFGVQAAVSGAQTIATWAVLWRMIRDDGGRSGHFNFGVLQRVWRFSAGMALTAIAGVLLANVGRILLSKFRPAEELGKYTLALTATGLLQMGIQPFYRAYFPRFAELFAGGEISQLRTLYYQGCRIVAGIVIPAGIIGALFAQVLFSAWLGRRDETAVIVFRWLLLGIGCSGLMWLPAAFQQAHGWTRLHAGMIVGALIVGGPGLLWAIDHWGTAGATLVWVLHGVTDITIGLWLMHRRLLKGEFLFWYRTVLLPPLACVLPIAVLSWSLMPSELGRWAGAAWLAVTSALVLVAVVIVVDPRSVNIDPLPASLPD